MGRYVFGASIMAQASAIKSRGADSSVATHRLKAAAAVRARGLLRLGVFPLTQAC